MTKSISKITRYISDWYRSLSSSRKALCALSTIMFLGVIGIAAYTRSTPAQTGGLSRFGVGVLVAGAAALVGGLLGFLFGIPRTLQNGSEENEDESDDSSNTENKNGKATRYRANTNLEQISDWLTKILVGVGLTQIGTLRNEFGTLANNAAMSLGGGTKSSALAGAILVFFGVSGFFYGYLWTRLFFKKALKEADAGELKSEMDKEFRAMKTQEDRSAEAISLVERHFHPHPDAPEVDPEELREAIIAASPPAKTIIFYRAWDYRRDNWTTNKERMERTIPVFQALIASDTEHLYHMNHGQLGFALKDQESPAWAEAETELTTAIEIRDRLKKGGWLYYELNRALCRIKLQQSEKDRSIIAQLERGILADLRAAVQNDGAKAIMKENSEIAEWLNQRKLEITDTDIRQSSNP